MTRTLGFLIFPGFQLLDAAGPMGAFEMPLRSIDPPPYELRVFAPESGLVKSSVGVAMPAESIDAAPRLDTLVVVGGWGVREALQQTRTLDFIRDQAASARRVASVC